MSDIYKVALIFDEVGKTKNAQVCADVFFSVDEGEPATRDTPATRDAIIYERCEVIEVNYDDYSFVRDGSRYLIQGDQIRPDWIAVVTDWLDAYIWANLERVELMIQESS